MEITISPTIEFETCIQHTAYIQSTKTLVYKTIYAQLFSLKMTELNSNRFVTNYTVNLTLNN